MPASHSSDGGGNFESESVATLSEWVADLSGIHSFGSKASLFFSLNVFLFGIILLLWYRIIAKQFNATNL